MLLGLAALAWLAWPNQARASCGYYVVIGRPGVDTAAEQARMRQEIPLEHQMTPCDGPQCRGEDRPITPAPIVMIAVQDPLALTMTVGHSDDENVSLASFEELSFFSDPHIWRSDPPPRA